MAPRKKKAVETNIVGTETVETKAEETEAVETKAAEAVVKEEAPKAKRTSTRKSAPKKAAETETVVKEEEAEKKPAKAPAKRTTKKTVQPEASVVIQCAGKEIVAKDVLAAATRAFQEAHEGVEIKTIELYIKPEESAAYYVVNGEASDEFKVEL